MLRAYGAAGRSILDNRENARPYLSGHAHQSYLPHSGAPRTSSFGPAARSGRRHVITTRRLAAILAADVAGYSRLIGADEEGTLNRLKVIRAEVIDPKVSEHRGRIVKTTGDGLLVEFASVIDALRCAIEWQTGMTERKTDTSDRRIEFRIGINVGDVVVEDGDIFGDGVNVAARLERFD